MIRRALPLFAAALLALPSILGPALDSMGSPYAACSDRCGKTALAAKE